MAVCGMHFIDLNIDALKKLRTHNKKLKEEIKFYNIVTESTSFENMQNEKA